jgi:hypothetical protein
LALFTAVAVLLVYTNYLGWMFLALGGVDLLTSGERRRLLWRYLLAIGAVGIAFLPLLPALMHSIPGEVRDQYTFTSAVAKALYLAYSLLASEMIAPWTWPGMLASAAAVVLVFLAVKEHSSRRALIWLALPFLITLGAARLAGARLVLFAPALLLFLTGMLAASRTRIAAALLAFIFALGWFGVISGQYVGTHRYTEPWRDVTAQASRMSRPGDIIICSHPSFYFYQSYLLHGRGPAGVPGRPEAISGRLFASLGAWRQAVEQAPSRVIYVRTTVMQGLEQPERDLRESLARNFRLVGEMHFDRDWGAPIKQRWFPTVSQPEWRIEIETWSK